MPGVPDRKIGCGPGYARPLLLRDGAGDDGSARRASAMAIAFTSPA